MRAVLLPGVCGSAIELDRWVFTSPYWMTPTRLAAGGPGPLLVNDGGTGDGPHPTFKRTVIGGPLASYYGRTVAHFQSLGHEVLQLGYDWRLGVLAAADGAWQRIREWAGDDPVYLLGHSLGGMVGRAVIRLAEAEGHGDQVVRLLTLGTPQQGSLAIVRLWARLTETYKLLKLVFYPALALSEAISPQGELLAHLDEVIGSFVSTYSLLPFDGAPTFGGGFDRAAEMDRNTYVTFNGWLLAQRFAAAITEQAILADSVYPAKQLSLIGVGVQTAYQVKDVARLAEPGGYHYDFGGDGTVDGASARLPGVPQVFCSGTEHSALPYEPSVLTRLPNLLFTGHD